MTSSVFYQRLIQMFSFFCKWMYLCFIHVNQTSPLFCQCLVWTTSSTCSSDCSLWFSCNNKMKSQIIIPVSVQFHIQGSSFLSVGTSVQFLYSLKGFCSLWPPLICYFDSEFLLDLSENRRHPLSWSCFGSGLDLDHSESSEPGYLWYNQLLLWLFFFFFLSLASCYWDTRNASMIKTQCFIWQFLSVI